MAGADFNMSSVTEAVADRLQLVIPDDLRRYRQWVLWRYEPGDDKPRKVPYYVSGGRRSGVQGSENDLAQMASFDDAVKAFRVGGFDGVGLAIVQNSPIKAIDIDNCVDGDLLPEAEAIVNEADSYAEISPSGGGVRILVYGVLPSRKAMNRYGPGRHLELFGSSGFVTVTGNVIGDSTVRPMSAAFQGWITKEVGESINKPEQQRTAPTAIVDERQRAELRSALNFLNADDYEVWADMGMALKTLGDVGRGLWLEWSQVSPRYDAQQAVKKWATFQPDGRISFRTVFHQATQAGWPNPMSGAAVPAPAAQEQKSPALQLLNLAELDEASKHVSWCVKHVLPADSIGVMFGAPGTFKSFIALDLALHVAHGLPWLGRKTKQGAVIYIAAEGGTGLMRRVKAWHEARGLDWNGIPFYVVPAAVMLSTRSSDVVEAAKSVGVVPSLVAVDTKSQTDEGEENSSTDTARYFRELGTWFRALWACTVLVLHHSGHSATERPRGSSAIVGNVDFMFGVFRDEKEMLATMVCERQKDGELFEEVSFSLTSNTLGHDEDGEAITSLSAQHINNSQALIEAHEREAAAGRGGRYQSFCGLLQTGVTEKQLRQAFYNLLPGMQMDAKKKAFYDQRTKALREGIFEFGTVSGSMEKVVIVRNGQP